MYGQYNYIPGQFSSTGQYGQPSASSWMQQQGQQLIRVTGIEGAKAYQIPPNSAVPFFDADNDLMYVKTTDGAGFPTIRTFAFYPVESAPQNQQQTADFVTRDEFSQVIAQIKEAIDGKLPVQQLAQQQRQPKRSAKPSGDDIAD